MTCLDCGEEHCDGACVEDPFGLDQVSTVVGSYGVGAEDLARVQAESGQEFDLDDSDGVDIELGELIEQPEAPKNVDPFAALDDPDALILLDGSDEQSTRQPARPGGLKPGGLQPIQTGPLQIPLAPPAAQGPDVVASGEVQLAVVLGRFLVEKKCIEFRPITIGRDEDLAVVLDNPSVSRRHCEIRGRSGQDVLCDLGAANGTFLDGQPVEQAQLRPGNVIGVGKFYLIYQPTEAQLAKLQVQAASAGRYHMASRDDHKPPAVLLAPSTKRQACLVANAGTAKERKIVLEKDLTLLGSGRGADIPLRGLAEKKHAVIERTGEGHLIAAQGWARVLVNGESVKRQLLRRGDVIRVGKQQFEYRS